ncbi:pyocin knob domain-containing protein [Paenibacillus sp. UMB7766-LJ446]|uniref:pyocin knob domain-containing protein n=1 Tax=Paenibacillus sp. UMB7766-LJ446 TaxID=3046313 RepID=UPI00254F011F|nr:pyocin knob domain-containing protein [Paenibacillus sp. UMB7766-LJ446]MDK8193961.1 pyocin knob domain-containing protein [Paenibacillus sp. UMB7766-LJ446]
MYNKQTWLDEIPDMTKPIYDASGKQKTDPQTGRPLFELVQAGTRITSSRLNTMEGGIEAAHTLVEQLAKELGGNFAVPVDGTMGLLCSAQGLKATWTAGIAYVNGGRYQVAAGEMLLNPTQGQYLYVDIDGAVKKTTSQATAKKGLTIFYVATDTSGVISTTDHRVNISLEEILKRLENVQIPDASLTEKGKVQLSDSINDTSKDKAATPSAIKQAYDLANEKQSTIKLANNFAAPDAAITLYPEGISVFYVGGGTGGQGGAWQIATGATEAFGYVETVRIGTGGYQMYTEMYSGTDTKNRTSNKQYKRNKRDSNSGWQPFERVLDADDLASVQSYVDDLSWQKFKLTEDLGYTKWLNTPDMNTLLDAGQFYSYDTTNGPVTGNVGNYIEIFRSATNMAMQRVTTVNTGQIFFRYKTSTTVWSAWAQIYPAKKSAWGAL